MEDFKFIYSAVFGFMNTPINLLGYSMTFMQLFIVGFILTAIGGIFYRLRD